MIYLEHAEDVLGKWLEWKANGKAALLVVTNTEGGAVRAPGAMMAVSEHGERAGYISGGCIDADAALQATAALKSNESKILRYGRNSPFIDLPLPCGGAIEVLIIPSIDEELIKSYYLQLKNRKPVTIRLPISGSHSDLSLRSPDYLTFRLTPKLQLRIAGRGADCIALARLASAAGIQTFLQLPDQRDVSEALKLDIAEVVSLTNSSELGPLIDDPWTAFLLAFHDVEWEKSLLSQAIAGPAFYIGAVGSRKTQLKRRELLMGSGLSTVQIDRIRGPVGLIPSMRNASMLAVSILSEIIQSFHMKIHSPFKNTALILLAAGQSSRFEDGDKLFASIRDQTVIDLSSSVLRHEEVAARFAVVAPGQHRRRDALERNGWTVHVNSQAESGMATSLACGVREVIKQENVDSALVLLSDMPNVSDSHLFDLRERFTPDKLMAFSSAENNISPPAIFSRNIFNHIVSISGDVGARQLLQMIDEYVTVPMCSWQGIDIDTVDDLMRCL